MGKQPSFINIVSTVLIAALTACAPAITKPTATLSPSLAPQPTPTLIPNGAGSFEFKYNEAHFSRGFVGGGRFIHAVAYADFNRDGYTDAFAAPVTGTEQGTPVHIYMGGPNNRFADETEDFIMGEIPLGIHPRKAIIADFNGDGWPDIYMADHGYDKEPFPGAINVLLLSNAAGQLLHTALTGDPVGFHHAAAAGDIDRDGDVDIFVTGPPNYVLLNDGSGDFSYDTLHIPESLYNEYSLFTAEFSDIDKDGFIDLIIGGHEYEGRATSIYWGSTLGRYTNDARTILDGVADYGIAIDFNIGDLDENGLPDVVISRPGSPPNRDFYDGFFIQILMQTESRVFVDESELRISNSSAASASWIDWLFLIDVDRDGDLDFVEEKNRNHVWRNDGSGYFIAQ